MWLSGSRAPSTTKRVSRLFFLATRQCSRCLALLDRVTLCADQSGARGQRRGSSACTPHDYVPWRGRWGISNTPLSAGSMACFENSKPSQDKSFIMWRLPVTCFSNASKSKRTQRNKQRKKTQKHRRKHSVSKMLRMLENAHTPRCLLCTCVPTFTGRRKH